MSATESDRSAYLAQQRWVEPLALCLIALGTVSRLAPLLDPHVRLLRQFMTEDGYLMQTVARNLGIGLGMTVSDGTIQTNGVQPLATFIFSICYFLSGGNKLGGVFGVELLSVVFSLASAAFLYALVKRILKGSADVRALALLVVAFWYASPFIVRHSMNGLETGLYFMMSLATMNVFLMFTEQSPSRMNAKQMLGLGVMLGLCFLARNDAVFFIAAVLLARFVLLWPVSSQLWRMRIVEAVVPGLISVLIGLPWLVYNYWLFGNVMPISGISESMNARFAQNLIYLPGALFKLTTLIIPFPLSVELRRPTMVLSALIVAAIVGFGAKMLWNQSKPARYTVVTYAIFGVPLTLFYGLYFGASYFVSRYLSVLSPFLAICSILVAYRLLLLIHDRLRRGALAVGLAGGTVAIIGLNAAIYHRGLTHDHLQVIKWVDAHVEPQTWVGAIQTGTLGFFHDRTINLDGKVNPDALRSAIANRTVIPYLVSSNIEYLVDWTGIAHWAQIDTDGFNQKFKLILLDEKANLAVLKRVDSSGR